MRPISSLATLSLLVSPLILAACIDFDAAKQSFCTDNPDCGNDPRVGFVRSLGGPGLEVVNALERSENQELVLGGFYTDSAQLGGAALGRFGQKDLFVARFKEDGAPIWSTGFGGTADDEINAVTVDALGAVYAVGDFTSGSISFGGDVPTVARQGTGSNGLVLRFSNTGELEWAVGIGGTTADALVSVRDVAVARDNASVLVTGTYRGTVLGGALVSTGNSLFLARLRTDGVLDGVLAQGTCTSGKIVGEGAVVDSQDNIYLTAQYDGTCTLKGLSLPAVPVGSPALVALRLRSDGSLLWAAASVQSDAFLSGRTRSTVDTKDNLIIVGSFKGSILKANGDKVEGRSRSTPDALLVKMDREAGSTLWAIGAGGTGVDDAFGVTVREDNSIWMTGSFEGTSADFRGATLSSQGQTDIFVAGYSETGVLRDAQAFGNASRQAGSGIVATSQGIALTGQFSGEMSFFVSPPISGNGSELFLTGLRL